jgi:hypothetical protein
MAGSKKSVAYGKLPAHVGKYEVWNDAIAPDAMKAILSAPTLRISEATSSADGKTGHATFDIDTSGLEPAWTQLLTSCPAAPVYAKPVFPSPSVSAAPAQ